MTRLFLATAILAAMVGLVGSAAGMGFPGRQDEIRGIHEALRFPLIEVTHVVTTEDGRHVAAAYYQHAQNRPGTDWNAWVALWDRVTGRRMIFRDAFGPVAISPDGGLLAMPAYERLPGGRTMGPAGPLALWRVGERKPERTLAWAETPAPAATAERGATNPIGIAFTPDGGHLIQLTAAGVLLLHDTRQSLEGKLLAKVSGKALPEGRWLTGEHVTLRINEGATELGLSTSRRGLAGGLAGRWKLDLAAGKAELVEEKAAPKPAAAKIGQPAPKLSATTGNGKLVITVEERGTLSVAQVEDGKVLETLRLDEAPEEQEAAGDRAGRR
jgi:hypothetical protein